MLGQNANINTGGIGKDTTDEVSQELKEVAIKATKMILSSFRQAKKSR